MDQETDDEKVVCLGCLKPVMLPTGLQPVVDPEIPAGGTGPISLFPPAIWGQAAPILGATQGGPGVLLWPVNVGMILLRAKGSMATYLSQDPGFCHPA